MDRIWPTDVFHLACVVQKTTETAFKNWDVSQISRFVALLVSHPHAGYPQHPLSHNAHESPIAGLLSHVQDLSGPTGV